MFFATISCFLTNGQSALRPKVQVQIRARKGQSHFLYDTGSQFCLLGKNEFRKISVNQRPRKLNVRLTCSGVSGKALKLLGCYLLETEVLGRKILHPYFVCENLPGSYSGVIGIDLIKKHGLSFDATTNQPYFEKTEKTLSAAVLTKSVYLPLVKLMDPFSMTFLRQPLTNMRSNTE